MDTSPSYEVIKKQHEILDILNDTYQELGRAMRMHSPMLSKYEAYAIISMQFDDYWAEACEKISDNTRLRKYLIQVAAMAVRAINDLDLPKTL